MPDWSLRSATPADVPAVLDLWSRAGSAASALDTVEVLTNMLAGWPDSLIVAVDAEELVGCIMWDFGGWRGHLYRLAVDTDHRGLGIARALVEEAERRLIEAGCKRINILVESDHPLAMRFWNATTYEPVPGVLSFVATLGAKDDQ